MDVGGTSYEQSLSVTTEASKLYTTQDMSLGSPTQYSAQLEMSSLNTASSAVTPPQDMEVETSLETSVDQQVSVFLLNML